MLLAMCLLRRQRPIGTQEKFPKISFLKVENFQLQNTVSDGKFVWCGKFSRVEMSI